MWLPDIGLGIGRAVGEYLGWRREWLYWFNEEGDRYPVPEEYQRYRADIAEQQVEAQRQAREQAEQQVEAERRRSESLAERLRALGIDPHSL